MCIGYKNGVYANKRVCIGQVFDPLGSPEDPVGSWRVGSHTGYKTMLLTVGGIFKHVRQMSECVVGCAP